MRVAIDLWLAGAARAWAVQRRVAPLMALRALVLLGPELVGAHAIERWQPRLLIASVVGWVVLECTVGSVIDRESTRLIAGHEALRWRGLGRAIRVALARTVVPLGVMVLPMAIVALLMREQREAAALVQPVLLGATGSLVAALIALGLHLRVAVAYAADDPRQAPGWMRTWLGLGVTVSSLTSTVRFGGAWAGSALASVAAAGDVMAMVLAIAAVGVVTRPLTLATWAEAWRVTHAPRSSARAEQER